MKHSQFHTVVISLLVCSSTLFLVVQASILLVIHDSEEQKSDRDPNFFKRLFRRSEETPRPNRDLTTEGSREQTPQKEGRSKPNASGSVKNDTLAVLIDEVGGKSASFLKEKIFGQNSMEEQEKIPNFWTLFSGDTKDNSDSERKDDNWFLKFFAEMIPTDGDETGGEDGKMEQKDRSQKPLRRKNGRGKNDFLVQELLKKTTLLESSSITSSIPEILGVLKEALDNAIDQMTKTFGKVLSSVGPTTTVALVYYLANQEEKHTPSWKRQQHRFYDKVKPQVVLQLHDALYLSQLAYVNTIAEFKRGLEDFQQGSWELAYGTTESLPAMPANFLLVQRNQAPWHDEYVESIFPWEKKKDNELQIALIVRGTKDLADIIADATLEVVDYRGGKTHGGILASGKALVDFYAPKLKELISHSGRDKIRLYIVGHSLGAGAGAIAAIEFNEFDFIKVEAVGFGCPALLSHELSESTKDYITTVVADADIVPRMSGASMVNAIIDLISFNWTAMAREDLEFTMDRIEKTTPIANIQNILPPKSQVLKWSEEFLNYTATEKFERATISLIPPGGCIHLFRDGIGFTGSVTPCTFFSSGVEISRTMVDDHLVIPGYHRALLTIMRDWSRDFNFDFVHNIAGIPC